MVYWCYCSLLGFIEAILMPKFRFLKPVLWLLILAIGHVPVPLVHDHECHRDGQLETHVKYFHGGAEQARNLGWHLHVYCLGLNHQISEDGFGVEGSSHDVVFFDELPQVFEQESVTSRRRDRRSRTRHSIYRRAECKYAWQFHNAGSSPHFLHRSLRLRNDVHLYDLYCSLLI
jgi:hypothetical protein